MKKIQKQYINKGKTFEKKIAQMKWNNLRELIRESEINQKGISGIPEALQHINRILKDVRTDIKYKD